MSQERLDDMSFLAIENDAAKSIDLNEAINIFAEKQARKKNF